MMRMRLSGFFQDCIMNATFSSHTELIIVDVTYKLNEFHIPLYLLLIVNGNGQSEIIGIYLTSHETQEAIMKMMRRLKSHNLKILL